MRGYYPDLVNGALVGALVKRLPAVGEPTIAIENGDVDEEGNPVVTVHDNPAYRTSEQVTIDALMSAANNAGITLFDVFISGEAPAGSVRLAFQIEVAPHATANESDVEKSYRLLVESAEQDTCAKLDQVVLRFA